MERSRQPAGVLEELSEGRIPTARSWVFLRLVGDTLGYCTCYYYYQKKILPF